jgi:hypothetical protein
VDNGRVSPHLYGEMNLPILEARPDWISASARTSVQSLQLGALAGEGINHEAGRGEKVRAWNTHGYEGFASGRWRWAANTEGVIVQVSQEEASIWAKSIAQLATHWSRVDYCVTALDEGGNVHPDVDYWLKWIDGTGIKRRNAQLTRIQEAWGGASVFVGSRASSHYLRCYDKHAESEGRYPAGSWRWEVELKGVASEHEHAFWQESEMSTNATAGLVSNAFRHYGLPLPWRATGRESQHFEDRQPADADRLLRWFSTQVNPSVQWVKSVRGLEPVTDALGLTEAIIDQRESLRKRIERRLE